VRASGDCGSVAQTCLLLLLLPDDSWCVASFFAGCYDGALYFLCVDCGRLRARFQTDPSAQTSDAEPIKACVHVDPHTVRIWVAGYNRQLYVLQLRSAANHSSESSADRRGCSTCGWNEPLPPAITLRGTKRRRTVAKEDVARLQQTSPAVAADPAEKEMNAELVPVSAFALGGAVYARVLQHPAHRYALSRLCCR
jgi:hypothetical protein